MSVNASHNLHHLIKYMKYTEYLKDKADRISQAWIDSNIRHVKEFKEVQKILPPELRKRPRKETFCVEPRKLNLKLVHPRRTPRPRRPRSWRRPRRTTRGCTVPMQSSRRWMLALPHNLVRVGFL